MSNDLSNDLIDDFLVLHDKLADETNSVIITFMCRETDMDIVARVEPISAIELLLSAIAFSEHLTPQQNCTLIELCDSIKRTKKQ